MPTAQVKGVNLHSGHAINLEEPDLFNRVMLYFLTMVNAGKWT
jgi:hypothetical protein